MTEVPWTEGDWIAYSFSGDWFVGFENDDSGPAITIRSWHDEREANANLIAAAPEMAAALAEIAEWSRRQNIALPSPSAYNALAKAYGKSP